ncbi:MAG: hypothetical protein CMO44_05205 [Verrucomicrobiales bacterium]|nr:hypothetical protein [Verrucomicrobiales bacterium]|tara:strand:+ start:842 stop:1258 length:417 start_codon:yes stop_codon:yes gene_type:complete
MAGYTALLDTPNFLPHVTIESGLSKEKAIETANRFKMYEKPFFSPSGWPKISRTKFENSIRTRDLEFYAVEQPLNTNGIFVDEIHISLAYSINRPITQMELAMAPFMERIYPTDLEVVVADCSEEDPNKWYIIDDESV